MLRIARPLGSAARRHLASKSLLPQTRFFAERKDGIVSSDPAFLPGTASQAVPVKTEVPLGPGGPGHPAPSSGSSSTSSPLVPEIPPENVPKTPPTPAQVKSAPPVPPAATSPPPATPPPAAKRRFRTFRLLLYLIALGALGYGGAVFYALRNDNFHDFFTEYIPFGEDAVLYFEERSFRKRFPNARYNTFRTTTQPRQDENRVTIPQKSGLSWRVAGEDAQSSGSDLTTKGKHMSAVDTKEPNKQERAEAKRDPSGATQKEISATVEASKADASTSGKTQPKAAKETLSPPKAVSSGEPKKAPSTTPPPPSADDRQPVLAPVSSIAVLELPGADESAVKDLVKIINDLITVINADGTSTANKYSAPVEKAKEELQSVAKQIGALKEAAGKAAEERVAQAHREFDAAAKSLLERIETSQKEDETRYLQEFEQERSKIVDQYEEKLKTELKRAQEVADQRLQNELTEQGIEMKRKFVSDIQGLVEAERDGRLSKLSLLSSSVEDLTNLTSNWNGVIDSNLATQRLQVAVDTVRSALQASGAASRPQPFVREMAALKLTAEGDPVVEAAVASVNPSAYQKGIPSASQLIDRFRRVASEVRKAALLPEDAGIASHAASVLLSRVMFKKQGLPEGNDVESILTRTESLLEEGDLDAAAREMNGLKGWAGVLSKDWLGDVRKVLEVKQALDVCETEARLQCLRLE